MPNGTVNMRAKNTSILDLADTIQYKSSKEFLEKALHIRAKAIADFAKRLFLAQSKRTGCCTMLTIEAKAARMKGVEISTE